jgi:uncharacterized protein (DUF608 family)
MKNHNSIPWPVLRSYSQDFTGRIALPLGGIGTGTVSLGGRGNLRDWEIMNRPAKGFVPVYYRSGPSFVLFARPEGGKPVSRLLEGKYPEELYEGPNGAKGLNHGLPRFEKCSFAAAYPLGQVFLADRDVPLKVTLQAFNPLVPGNVADSSLPVAILRFQLHNPGRKTVKASVCGSIPAFMVADDSGKNPAPYLNQNVFRDSGRVRGVFMRSRGGNPKAERRGTVTLATTAAKNVSCRIAWRDRGWGSALLDFWNDFSTDGKLDPCPANKGEINPVASLAAGVSIAPGETASITFLVTWHFPNRYSWTPAVKEKNGCYCSDRRKDWVGNHYAIMFRDSWDAASRIAARLPELEEKTVEFARVFCGQSLPLAVKEAALNNLTALRSQTTFRTADGRFFGWEGCCDTQGCCHGSCTHVWNYDQATPFLFGEAAKNMRDTEFNLATDKRGMMSFRVNLPVSRAREFGKAAADGQMGCVMKMYREWQLSGDDKLLRALWPKVKKALSFCWIRGGWDADRDGVMEGCQHNTMDVEYFGPNPQMQGWYLGALRAAAEMAFYLGDYNFAEQCRHLFARGKKWMDQHLFNGEYYEHEIRPPRGKEDIASCLLVGMGAKNMREPDYQLGKGCLVDQLVGQFMAHVCGLGYLHEPAHVRKTLRSIMRYNRLPAFNKHFNCLRSYALGDEAALLMASYPKGRLANPFPYFTEVMTGFEYTAAAGMLYEGQVENGLRCVSDVRARYDGRKRNPFDEAECGHHYARATASWALVTALTGFQYSGVNKSISFARGSGPWFWSNGYEWGSCRQRRSGKSVQVQLKVCAGELVLRSFQLAGSAKMEWRNDKLIRAGEQLKLKVII